MQNTSASFGIDHPLIAVNDIEQLRERLISLGFYMTATGKHPWGTSTSLAIFKNCLLEIMGIYDDQLLDVKPAGEFRFGRHVHSWLQQREGVALTALHSVDIHNDVDTAARAGLTVSGLLEFGREVQLGDGRVDRTRTTLALLPDHSQPRMSFFLCQQHRRDLVEVPEWMAHDNSVYGVQGVLIKASREQQIPLRALLSNLYGQPTELLDGFSVQTPNGAIEVQQTETIEAALGPLPQVVLQDEQPGIVGITLLCTHLHTLARFAENASLDFRRTGNRICLARPELFGNIFLQFEEREA